MKIHAPESWRQEDGKHPPGKEFQRDAVFGIKLFE
jgi:hypothetical protein